MTVPYPAAPPTPYQQPWPPAQQPQQYAPPPQGYPQQYPPQQGYPAPQMAPPAPQLAQGSIDDFFNQPSTGGGKSLSFEQLGQRYIGIVTREVGPGDIQQQTDTQQRPLFFKDGRPKFVMRVPLQIQPQPGYDDGLAQWYVKGATRDELARAMSEAGAPAGPPEPGAIIDVTFTGTRPAGVGMNPAKLFRVVYTRPNGAPPAQQPAPAQQPPAGGMVSGTVAYVGEQGPELTQGMQGAQIYAPPPTPPVQVQQPPAQAAPQGPALSAPVTPNELSPDQQKLLARLTQQSGQ